MNLLDAIGGPSGCKTLSQAFYARVKADPVLRPFFPGKTLTCAIEEFSAFLVQLLHGPAADSQRRWWVSIRESHRRFRLGAPERAAWLANMDLTLDSLPLPEEARAELRSFFRHSSTYVTGLPPDGSDAPHGETRAGWHYQKLLDQAVAAIRGGDAAQAIACAERCRDHQGNSGWVGLLGLLLGIAPEYVRRLVREEPGLREARFNGRTLLHEAAARGQVETVQLLLDLGCDPNALDGGAHTPLYSVANQCSSSTGVEVVRLLVGRGARVNDCAGVKRTTPLHMAARRGFIGIALALLDCGADRSARDSGGVTPAQRARNCRKLECAEAIERYRRGIIV